MYSNFSTIFSIFFQNAWGNVREKILLTSANLVCVVPTRGSPQNMGWNIAKKNAIVIFYAHVAQTKLSD